MSVPAPFFDSDRVTIWHADARDASGWLPAGSVDAIVTSPPYFGLRDYGVDGQIGLEDDPQTYVDGLADLLTGYVDVLKPGGSLWLNLGDAYAANRTYQVNQTRNDGPEARAQLDSKPMTVPDGWQPKCLLMTPERVALALIARGWVLRNKVVWAKPNPMPSSVQDRLNTTWEYVFHLVRQRTYYYDLDAIREPAKSTAGEYERAAASVRANHRLGTINGTPVNETSFREFDGRKNPGDVWEITTKPYPEAHFAVFPSELVERPIKATVPQKVCRGCGTPRERVTERQGGPQGSHVLAEGESYAGDVRTNSAMQSGGQLAARYREHGYPTYETVGWTDCGCGDGWQPGVVLDPFAGSGTVGNMARRLGRRAWLVDLNADYCRLAADRFRQEVLPL